MIGYNELCKMLNEDSDWKVIRNDEVLAPVTFKGNQFIAFDDKESITAKVNNKVQTKIKLKF